MMKNVSSEIAFDEVRCIPARLELDKANWLIVLSVNIFESVAWYNYRGESIITK
jgi:hypothetical protein